MLTISGCDKCDKRKNSSRHGIMFRVRLRGGGEYIEPRVKKKFLSNKSNKMLYQKQDKNHNERIERETS